MVQKMKVANFNTTEICFRRLSSYYMWNIWGLFLSTAGQYNTCKKLSMQFQVVCLIC